MTTSKFQKFKILVTDIITENKTKPEINSSGRENIGKMENAENGIIPKKRTNGSYPTDMKIKATLVYPLCYNIL
jgi:hypothetical protein